MICCNKCGTVIPEPKEDPREDDPSDKRSRYKKEASKEDLPQRRPSLISMPMQRAANGYNFDDVDLCASCKGILYRRVNDVKFQFMFENDTP